MSRRKQTVVEKAVADAAKELGLPRDSWNVQRLSTMMVMLAVAQHRFGTTRSSQSAADILTLMDSISKLRAEAKAHEPLQITLHYAENYIGICTVTCPHCHMSARHEITQRDPAAPATPPAPAADAAPTDLSPGVTALYGAAPAKNADGSMAERLHGADKVVPLPVVHVREGVSVSNFHSQQLQSGECPPLRHIHHQGGQLVR